MTAGAGEVESNEIECCGGMWRYVAQCGGGIKINLRPENQGNYTSGRLGQGGGRNISKENLVLSG